MTYRPTGGVERQPEWDVPLGCRSGTQVMLPVIGIRSPRTRCAVTRAHRHERPSQRHVSASERMAGPCLGPWIAAEAKAYGHAHERRSRVGQAKEAGALRDALGRCAWHDSVVRVEPVSERRTGRPGRVVVDGLLPGCGHGELGHAARRSEDESSRLTWDA